MAGESKITTDHEEIRTWAEARKARPCTVKGTERQEEEVGIIRLDLPGYSGGGKLEEITWEEYFDKFEESNLAFLFQEETKDGKKSNFNKFISREAAYK